MQFPGIVSVQGMLSTGLTARAGWMFDGLKDDEERLAFLSIVYPNAPMAEIRKALDVARNAKQIASVLMARGTMPPLDQIPVNSNIKE